MFLKFCFPPFYHILHHKSVTPVSLMVGNRLSTYVTCHRRGGKRGKVTKWIAWRTSTFVWPNFDDAWQTSNNAEQTVRKKLSIRPHIWISSKITRRKHFQLEISNLKAFLKIKKKFTLTKRLLNHYSIFKNNRITRMFIRSGQSSWKNVNKNCSAQDDTDFILWRHHEIGLFF